MTYSFILANLLSTITIFSFGIIFSKIFVEKFEKPILEEIAFYGFIFLSFLGLILHFFFPLNHVIGNLIIIFSLSYFLLFFFKSDQKKKLTKYILIVSSISILLLYASNINRPDAGLYHLPYTKYLQENKIILGLANIHHRFGHVSIVQYISALYNNSFFPEEYITVPLSNIFGFFFTYLLKLIFKFKNFFNIKNFFLLLLSIFSFYSFSRYSNYGNDAVSHMFFFLIIINLLFLENIKIKNLIKINLFSIFCFLNKTFMIIVLLIPLFLNIKFFLKEKKIDINPNVLFCIILVISWLIKNILISGCLLYPVSLSCIKSLSYVDISNTKQVEIEGSAWSKEIRNEQILKIPREVYIKNFNWVNGWFQFHFKKIIEKISPLIIILFLLVIIKIILARCKFKELEYDKNILNIFIFCSIFFIIWFLKFPLYRFGLSYISVLIISIVCILSSIIKNQNNVNFFTKFSYFLIVLSVLGFVYKNGLRIVNSNDEVYTKYPWPKIYTLSENNKNLPNENKKIYNSDGEFIYFYSQGECLFNSSPCSNYKKNNLKIKYFLNYKIILPN